jgi:hypothetical protein
MPTPPLRTRLNGRTSSFSRQVPDWLNAKNNESLNLGPFIRESPIGQEQVAGQLSIKLVKARHYRDGILVNCCVSPSQSHHVLVDYRLQFRELRDQDRMEEAFALAPHFGMFVRVENAKGAVHSLQTFGMIMGDTVCEDLRLDRSVLVDKEQLLISIERIVWIQFSWPGGQVTELCTDQGPWTFALRLR